VSGIILRVVSLLLTFILSRLMMVSILSAAYFIAMLSVVILKVIKLSRMLLRVISILCVAYFIVSLSCHFA
jgi:hypothetical protein